MSVPARLEYQLGTEGRSAPRHTLHLDSVLAGSGDEVVIHNLSVNGFLIETSAVLTAGAMLEVELPERGSTAAWVVWRKNRLYGCEFASRVSEAVISAALLRNPLPASATELTRVSDSTEGKGEPDLYSPRARMLTIFGLSAALWLVIGFVVFSLV